MKKAFGLAIIFSIVALVFVGCGEKLAEKATEEALEGVTGTDIDVDEGRVTIEDTNGNVYSQTTSAEIPDDWPSDAPYYDGDLAASSSLVMGDEESYVLTITTKDEEEKIFDYYREELVNEGWTITSDARSSLGTESIILSMIIAEKGNMTLSVGISYQEDKETLNISQTVMVTN